MQGMSRKCVPYTPVCGKLSEMTIAMVSSTGVYLEGQPPFGDDTDDSYRILPGDLNPAELRFKHGHYDESQAQQDANTVFPMELLQEFAKEGVIKRVGNKNIGFRGFTTNLKLMYEQVAPAIAAEIERSQAEGVVLTGGCPVCHRVVVAVQREIEAKGIPTVIITAVPGETKLMRPPRAIYPVGSKPGHILGSAGEQEKHKRVLLEALRQFEVLRVPGEIVEFSV